MSEGLDERLALYSIGYLRKNDFTEVCHLGRRLLTAKDGKRDVFIWIDFRGPIATIRETMVPLHVIEMAKSHGARLDALSLWIAGPDTLVLRHDMNVLE